MAAEGGAGAPIAITVNGERREVPPGTTAAGLLALLEVRTDAVALERNRVVVRRRDLATTALAEGDAVEVVTLVGGG